MPAASAQRPISPPSASTSRTKWPLPMPPIDGLHDISPMLEAFCVTRSVEAPSRAAAAAASQPAWPPPTTITSASSAVFDVENVRLAAPLRAAARRSDADLIVGSRAHAR